MIPNASRLAKIQGITIRGTVLRPQTAHWDPRTLRQRLVSGRSKDRYIQLHDGSLSFFIGVKSLQPHVTCVMSDGEAVLSQINSVGAKVTITGFLRSSFEYPGLESTDNARIFEVNPIRTLEVDGEVWTFDLSHPSLVRNWPAELNEADERRKVQYWKGRDTFVFSNIGTEERGFFRVTGEVHDIKLNNGTSRPAWFVLNKGNATRQIRVTCLQGTRPARALRTLKSAPNSVRCRRLDAVDHDPTAPKAATRHK
jgi:hypothetical protein